MCVIYSAVRLGGNAYFRFNSLANEIMKMKYEKCWTRWKRVFGEAKALDGDVRIGGFFFEFFDCEVF